VLSLSPATRIWVALEPVDMRLGFNGLSARVQTVLDQEVLTGHLFLFTNKLRNRIRVLYWDGSGLWVCAKRLEKGTFGWPFQPLSAPGRIAAVAAWNRGHGSAALVSDLNHFFISSIFC
jgi:transposase